VKDHIHRLIAEGEHQRLDFKFEIADARKIAKTLVAFSNSDGGRLLIGVKDNGAIAGVRSDEEYYMLEAAAKIYCKPPVPFTFKEWRVNGKTVLEVTILKSEIKPHFAESRPGTWQAFIRSADQNFPANRILLRVWKNEKRATGVSLHITEPEKLLLRYLTDNPSVTLSAFARLAKISRSRAENILVRFVSLKLIEIQFGENQVRYIPNPAIFASG
jgi:predicted HTH transcriptional regulator